MGQVIVEFAVLAAAAGLSGLGYRLGMRHRLACLVPWSLLEELVTHKLCCCGEDPARVKLELSAYLRLAHEEVEGLVRRALANGETASVRSTLRAG